MATFLLLWNPLRFDDQGWFQKAAMSAVAGEAIGLRRWSAGARRAYVHGDRVFMLKQGVEPRGIVASGRVGGQGVYRAAHYESGKSSEHTYVDVVWDAAVTPDAPLPLTLLKATVPSANWRPQAGGQSLDAAQAAAVERMWQQFIGHGRADAGRLPDANVRRAIEDHAQRVLEEAYRSKGWTVRDVRYGNPFDAVAERDGRTLYLEAKGTTTEGLSVEVTSAEVRFARGHPGECVLGIVSGIEVDGAGEVLMGSGSLREYPWDPDAGALEPVILRWTPPT